jgi:multidrug efflux pump subunit AcrA (membrane-fusion protein)
MKTFRVLLTVAAAVASLICPCTVFAGTPVTVVPQDHNGAGLLRDLRGAPDNVKTLILSFDQVADKYLQQQRALLSQLKTATTAAERATIRAQLQANRQAFLDELKSFRQELRADLQTLKGEITHTEVLRILEAAQDAAGPVNARHRGMH